MKNLLSKRTARHAALIAALYAFSALVLALTH